MIEVRDLVKRYGRHLAVDHLSFTVPDGQIFGFLGPNGAGKSTTMNLMTGYLGPTEGEILVDGHSVTQEPEGTLLFRWDFADGDELLRWLLTFGDQAELLEPADLRRELGALAKKISEKYDS